MGSDILEWFRFRAGKARSTSSALLIVFATCLCVALIPIRSNNSPESANPATVQNDLPSGFLPFSMAPGTDLALPLKSRPVYPYSIIPGGVSSTRELKSAIATDPVVAAHYSGFDLTKARVVQLKKELAAFVSYRKGNNVYWTSHKLVLHAGENVITDGHHLARTRCGNQISETAVKPVNSRDPTITELETPEPDRQSFPADSPLGPWIGSNPVAQVSTPPGSDNGGFFPPIIPIFFGGGSPSHPSHNPPPPPETPPSGPPPPVTPPTTVPEPGSMLLLATGISATLAMSRKFKPPKQ